MFPYRSRWTEGFGQLTSLGMQQGHALGQSLRNRYVVQHNLLREKYTRRDIVVRSTDYDRTLQTVESLLMALYPEGPLQPKDVQPVPEHTVLKVDDLLLRAWDNSTCPALTAAMKKESNGVHKSEWDKNIALLNGIVDSLSNATGVPAATININNLFKLTDVMLCNDAHGYPMPGLNAHVKNVSMEVSKFQMEEIFGTPTLHKLTAGRLVNELVARLHAAAAGDPQPGWDKTTFPSGDKTRGTGTGPRMAIYSAHDTTVLAVLKALGAYDGVLPPYASSVVIELVRSGSKSARVLRGGEAAETHAAPRAFMHLADEEVDSHGHPRRMTRRNREYLHAAASLSANEYTVRMWYNHGHTQATMFRPQDRVVPAGCRTEQEGDKDCSLEAFVHAADPVSVAEDEIGSLCHVGSGCPSHKTLTWNNANKSVTIGVGVAGLLFGVLLSFIVTAMTRRFCGWDDPTVQDPSHQLLDTTHN